MYVQHHIGIGIITITNYNKDDPFFQCNRWYVASSSENNRLEKATKWQKKKESPEASVW